MWRCDNYKSTLQITNKSTLKAFKEFLEKLDDQETKSGVVISGNTIYTNDDFFEHYYSAIEGAIAPFYQKYKDLSGILYYQDEHDGPLAYEFKDGKMYLLSLSDKKGWVRGKAIKDLPSFEEVISKPAKTILSLPFPPLDSSYYQENLYIAQHFTLLTNKHDFFTVTFNDKVLLKKKAFSLKELTDIMAKENLYFKDLKYKMKNLKEFEDFFDSEYTSSFEKELHSNIYPKFFKAYQDKKLFIEKNEKKKEEEKNKFISLERSLQKEASSKAVSAEKLVDLLSSHPNIKMTNGKDHAFFIRAGKEILVGTDVYFDDLNLGKDGAFPEYYDRNETKKFRKYINQFGWDLEYRDWEAIVLYQIR